MCGSQIICHRRETRSLSPCVGPCSASGANCREIDDGRVEAEHVAIEPRTRAGVGEVRVLLYESVEPRERRGGHRAPEAGAPNDLVKRLPVSLAGPSLAPGVDSEAQSLEVYPGGKVRVLPRPRQLHSFSRGHEPIRRVLFYISHLEHAPNRIDMAHQEEHRPPLPDHRREGEPKEIDPGNERRALLVGQTTFRELLRLGPTARPDHAPDSRRRRQLARAVPSSSSEAAPFACSRRSGSAYRYPAPSRPALPRPGWPWAWASFRSSDLPRRPSSRTSPDSTRAPQERPAPALTLRGRSHRGSSTRHWPDP
jgi:hypothetical protein